RTTWFYLFKDLTVVLLGLLLMPLLARQALGDVAMDGDVPLLLLGAAVLVVLPFAVSGVGTALLATTMRKSNGYRMLHEWLSGTERDGWRWDAFVAAPGCLLTDLVNRRRRLSWPEALTLLESLAGELDEATQDGSLPASLALSQVWVQPSGQALLLEAPLRLDA